MGNAGILAPNVGPRHSFLPIFFIPLLRVSHAEEGIFFFLSLVTAKSSFSHCEPFFQSSRTLLSFIAKSSFSHCEPFFHSSRNLLSVIANLFSVVVIFTFCQFVFVLLRMGGRIPEVAKRKSPGARRGALSGGLSFSYDRVNVVCCLTSVGGLFLFAFAGGFSLAFADGHLVAGHFLNESGVSCLDEDVVPLHKFADIGEVNAVAVPVGQGLVHDVL